MPRAPQDPGRPRRTAVSTKLGETDASRVLELANQAGLSRSEFIRELLLGALGRGEPPEPDG